MTEFTRYAVFHAPPQGPLWTFVSAWLGWNAADGQAVPHPEIGALPKPIAHMTRGPRKYGFHGTIKPPFRLAKGCSDDDLRHQLARLSAHLSPVLLEGLTLAQIGGFLALVPVGPEEPLRQMAAEVVQGLDRFRAPLRDDELMRRRKRPLSERQERYLLQWGYPYVFDEFRFHMTLTGGLGQQDRDQTHAALAPRLAPLLPRPYRIDDLCLFGEAADGRFHILDRFPLSGPGITTQ